MQYAKRKKTPYQDKISTNVLVIGRSGAGKSSFLNYVLGAPKQKVKAGNEGTPKEIKGYPYLHDDLTINIYDTWGLTAENYEEWTALIMDSVKEHDKKEIHDWYNTIIFCTSGSYNNGRFETFESDLIKKLLKEKNNVIVALTNCVNPDDENQTKFRDNRICPDTGLNTSDVVLVSNINETRIDGTKLVQFGKEAVLKLIICNLWKTFKGKVPFALRKNLDNKFENEKTHLIDNIQKKHFSLAGAGNLEKFQSKLNVSIENLISETASEINDKIENAYAYYDKLSRQFCKLGLFIDESKMINNIEFAVKEKEKFEKQIDDWLKKFEKGKQNIKNDLNESIEKVGIFKIIRNLLVDLAVHLKNSKSIKTSLINSVNEIFDKLNEEFSKQLDEIEKYINTLNVEKYYTQVS